MGSVTGLLPSPLPVTAAPGTEALTPEATADEVVTPFFRRIRYLLTLKGRPPFRLAGRETDDQFHDVTGFGLDLLSQHDDPRLAELVQGLGTALFHCYDVPGLPRTHNELESGFRDTTRRLLRTTGQKGLTQCTLKRQGAWKLLPSPATEARLCDALPHIPPEDLAQERQRFADHRRRFAMQRRSPRQTKRQFAQLHQMWETLPATGTG